ncbi:calcium-binding protein [Streptomyces zagrosensis]|uniref:Uncharacterized protein n=1 Tax=Streptomyces zagrosensis TaxID=1042984 RepID=A0A7W9UX82_9ACTN|nr:calcium-binding protein [Streptomyces zagrosensis]MBB5934337.1 hypothetical protein [Streptomyces zagrosensis]
MSTWAPAALEALIEEATRDAYGEDEQLTGFFTMIEESLVVPFTTTVLGVEVSVVGVDLAEDARVVARCARGTARQNIGIVDLPLPEPAPEGAQWIEAYRIGPAELARRTTAQLSCCSKGQSPRLPLTGPTAGNRGEMARILANACRHG